MNETKHAPGPWNMGRGRTSLDDPTFWLVDVLNRSKTLRVARVAGVGKDEAVANARVIHAAPDLLAACDEALTWWHSKPSNFYKKEPDWLTTIRAAIAKATGE